MLLECFQKSPMSVYSVFFLMAIHATGFTHTHKHTHSSTQAGAGLLMPLLPSGPAASWHLSPWRRLIASSVLARGERHAERVKPSLHPFICLLQRWPSPIFSFVLLAPFVPSTGAFYLPHHCRPLSSRTPKNERKKKKIMTDQLFQI